MKSIRRKKTHMLFYILLVEYRNGFSRKFWCVQTCCSFQWNCQFRLAASQMCQTISRKAHARAHRPCSISFYLFIFSTKSKWQNTPTAILLPCGPVIIFCISFARVEQSMRVHIGAAQYLFGLVKSIKMTWPRKYCVHTGRPHRPISEIPVFCTVNFSPFESNKKIHNDTVTDIQPRTHLNVRNHQINSELIAFIFERKKGK